MSEKCTCLSATELAQMRARNQPVQPRYPCPVHPEPEYPPGAFLPCIEPGLLNIETDRRFGGGER